MKKVLISLFALLTVAGMNAQRGYFPIQENLDSTQLSTLQFDTLESYQVGPGIIYTRFDVNKNGRIRHCFIYEVDLNNPYNRVEESHSKNLRSTEQMIVAHARLDSAGHRSIGSVNCNFWITNDNEGLLGVGCTGHVRNGKIGACITTWNTGRGPADEEIGYLMMDKAKRAFIKQYGQDGKIYFGDKSYTIRETNRNRNNPKSNEIILLNSDLGSNPTRTIQDGWNGKEVMVQMVDDWVINHTMRAVVTDINETGGTIIPEGYAVFQGRGSGRTFLDTLVIGDTVRFDIGIYASKDHDERPEVDQLTGGNCLVMVDGRLTVRNWNEDYNNREYARTGFATNATHDKLWLMVMQTPGMFTHEMCSIFRYFGATEAAGADGGGSAQMNLFGKILNPTTESTARPVGNSIFLFSTAPDREVNEAAKITYVDWRADEIPSFAVYTPAIRAYSEEGVLLTEHFDGYTLTCEPASLGTISADGKTFTAGQGGQTGKLIATYGNARTEKTITTKDGVVMTRLDSVLVGNSGYRIEVNTVSGDRVMPVQTERLDWTVDDEGIATVTAGTVKGVSNGRTIAHGSIGAFSDDIILNIEMVDAPHKTTALVMDTTVSFTSTRNQSVTKHFGEALFGCPDSVMLVINTTAPVNIIDLTVRANNLPIDSAATGKKSELLTAGQDYVFAFALDNLVRLTDQATFPIWLESIKLSMKDPKKNKDYNIQIKEIVLCYKNWQQASGLMEAIQNNAALMQDRKIMVNGKVFILRDGKAFDLKGNRVR